MKIAVCVKRVPDMDVRFRVASDGASLDESGVKFDLNDFDAWAVEAALQLKESAAQGEVVVLSLGPAAVQETIRKALSMGADRGIHLQADRIPFDAFAIASALAAELRDGGYDLVLFGKLSPDSSNSATGPIVAELLDIACVTAISSLEISDGKGTAKRELEGAQEIVEFSLPAALTIDEGLNTARYPSLKGIMAAKKKTLESKPAQLGEPKVKVERLELPPDRAAGRIVGEGSAAVPELIRLLQTEAKVL
ncbi:MAG TPA: electron transfer flavoprotein subunit beta/FixA family protein [Gemmatimonadaceae bacterium]|nr:electron transfer flavoprotein subunit beta/FixA family protein [Gemmatimonadaceae bacterium]